LNTSEERQSARKIAEKTSRAAIAEHSMMKCVETQMPLVISNFLKSLLEDKVIGYLFILYCVWSLEASQECLAERNDDRIERSITQLPDGSVAGTINIWSARNNAENASEADIAEQSMMRFVETQERLVISYFCRTLLKD
jgi:hypothetical protein